MLLHLSVRDFLLIEELDLDFQPGLSVITGQTGSGKSMILEAILFGLGKKSSKSILRAGADHCQVTLTLALSLDIQTSFAQKFDIAFQEPVLVIKRVKTITGQNKFLVNNKHVQQKVLGTILDSYVEFYGQHAYTLLLDPLKYVDILDEYGGLLAKRSRVQSLYKTWKSQEKQLLALEENGEIRRKNISYLHYVLKELEDAKITQGEQDQLVVSIDQLKARDGEKQLIKDTLVDLKSSNIYRILEHAKKRLQKSVGENTGAILSHLSEAYDHIEYASTLLESYFRDLDRPEEDLASQEERLLTLKSLARKHHCSIEQLYECMENYRRQLSVLEEDTSRCDHLSLSLGNIKDEFLQAAQELSDLRKRCASQLEECVNATLALLHMPQAAFGIDIQSGPTYCCSTGIDRIRFVAAVNPGSSRQDIAKIASGGELSRLMLGLRAALMDKSTPRVIIFDEIDVGISGQVAHAVGQYLRQLSQIAQVIVITHQPQVAGKANGHILVEKEQHARHTTVRAKLLNRRDREQELAKMIAGEQVTEVSLHAARELLSH